MGLSHKGTENVRRFKNTRGDVSCTRLASQNASTGVGVKSIDNMSPSANVLGNIVPKVLLLKRSGSRSRGMPTSYNEAAARARSVQRRGLAPPLSSPDEPGGVPRQSAQPARTVK